MIYTRILSFEEASVNFLRLIAADVDFDCPFDVVAAHSDQIIRQIGG